MAISEKRTKSGRSVIRIETDLIGKGNGNSPNAVVELLEVIGILHDAMMANITALQQVIATFPKASA